MRTTLWNVFGAGTVAALCVSALLNAAASASVADAAERGDKDGVRALLKQAADVNAAQADGMTALHWAASRDDARPDVIRRPDASSPGSRVCPRLAVVEQCPSQEP